MIRGLRATSCLRLRGLANRLAAQPVPGRLALLRYGATPSIA
jgi:hypothetical protein